MRKAVWAEWLIARFTDRSRAASIVGDLLETAEEEGTLWFWVSVGTVISRPIIAFVATFYIGLFWRREFTIQANILPYQSRPNLWRLIVECLRLGIPPGNMSELHFRAVWLGTVLWMFVPYTAIRYGLRDKFAQLALGFCCLVTVAVFFWWTPVVTIACIGLALPFFIVGVRSAMWRRALVALTAALVFAFAGGLLSMYLRVALEKEFYYALARSGLSGRTVIFFFWLLAVWITTTACARVHDRLVQHHQQDLEIETTA